MQLPNRFAFYGLIGAFFWTCQLLLLLLSGDFSFFFQIIESDIVSELTKIPASFQTLIATILGLFAITVIFFTGLIFDLAAAYFKIPEMGIFKRHVDRNKVWLGNLANYHKLYAGSDLMKFQEQFGDIFSKREWIGGFNIFLFWKKERRQRFWGDYKKSWNRWKLIKVHDRLTSFLLSYIEVMSGSPQLTLLIDEIYQWRVGRAISTALVFVYMQTIFTGAYFKLTDKIPFDSVFSILLIPLPLLFILLTFVITLMTYSRVCYSLFSLAFVTMEKHRLTEGKKVHKT